MHPKKITFLFTLAFFVTTAISANAFFDKLKDVTKIVKTTVKVGKAVSKTFEDITPEQEYYIGRAVAASVLSKYAPYDIMEVNDYINILGQTLAKASDVPETFGGYHFLVLDSDEINAFAAPGGLIFVTRGMIACCTTEDALAAVLAHEIAHVQLKHGLRAIKQSRMVSAAKVVGEEAVSHFGSNDLKAIAGAFENTIGDITETMIVKGYSRTLEEEADKSAVQLLNRVGYPAAGLTAMLREMGERIQPGGLDFAKTHPSPKNRLDYIRDIVGDETQINAPESRAARFAAFKNQI